MTLQEGEGNEARLVSGTYARERSESQSGHRHHVGASYVSLAPIFLQKSERAHAAAPPFQTEPASLGVGWVICARDFLYYKKRPFTSVKGRSCYCSRN